MKKILLHIVLFGLFVGTLESCENSKKTDTRIDFIVKGGTTVKKSITKMETVKSNVPTFSSDEVNKGLAEYAKLKDDYITALKKNNKAQVEALKTKYTVWAQGAVNWGSKLKADEVQKYSEYVTKLSQEWEAASQEAVQ